MVLVSPPEGPAMRKMCDHLAEVIADKGQEEEDRIMEENKGKAVFWFVLCMAEIRYFVPFAAG